MITNQLERLKQDYLELDYFIQRLQKEGNEYLESYIQSMQTQMNVPQVLESAA